LTGLLAKTVFPPLENLDVLTIVDNRKGSVTRKVGLLVLPENKLAFFVVPFLVVLHLHLYFEAKYCDSLDMILYIESYFKQN
tara:strand:+ start:731 stop:976 length:246 start_codon:yes stop_codon:yes gene_type:complete